MNRTLTGLILLVLLAAVAFALVPGVEGQDKARLRIGFNTWVGYGPLYVAQEKGYFSEHGLQVELERIEGTPERRSALIAKRLDILGSTIDDLIVGASQGVEARLICGCDESNGADGVLVKNDIASIKDLKGRSVAVQPGFVNHFFLLYLLDREGMSPDDVKIEPMEPDKAGAAFVAGQLDVAVTWEPWLSKAKERPDGKLLATSKDAPGVIVDILIARNDLIKERAGDLTKLVRAWNQAVEFCRTNADEANEIIARNMGLSKEEAADMLSGVNLFGAKENESYVKGGKAAEIAAKCAELLFKGKVIETKPDVKSLISTDFVGGSAEHPKKGDHPKKGEHPDHPKK